MASSAEAVTGTAAAVTFSLDLTSELALELPSELTVLLVTSLLAVGGVLSFTAGAVATGELAAGNGSIGSGRIQIINKTVKTAGITK